MKNLTSRWINFYPCRLFSAQKTTQALHIVSSKFLFKTQLLDVAAAFEDYLAHDNDGRPFVLIGHSQGSGMLLQLLKDRIDGTPLQDRMLSAMLTGTNVAVPKGKTVGGDLKSIPLCQSDDQTGCIIAYVSFRADAPPPAQTLFGRVRGGDGTTEVACTNPAALGSSDDVELDAYLGADGAGASSPPQMPWLGGDPVVETPFVKVPGLLTGTCESNEAGNYLAVTVHADPDDPRTDTISGDVAPGGDPLPGWGLHLIDVNVVQGDLIGLVESQAAAHKAD